ncbi:MAG: carbamoylphosphate synthase large subunit short form [Candidatus Parcubacteria bacterium]|nr:MAG: carbamoylphosphate synthase large subunit short form [Candidatus Parcubacteria bacterium]
MDRPVNVLIYPSGSENALEVKDALSYKLNITIWGASSRKDHSIYVYQNYFEAPNVNEESFLEQFNLLLTKHKIDFIIPTHDTVSLKLSELKNELKAILISSDYETNRVCRYKKETYKLFTKYDFCPKVYDDINLVDNWPIFIKPNIGEGGKNSFIAENLKEFECIKTLLKQDSLILEYLPGKEFTVDCFTDKNGNLRYIGARERNRIWGGISVNSRTVSNQRIFDIAKIINHKLKFRGYWYFQVKEDNDGNLKLLEISTRPAGTMALYRQRGINFMLLSIYDFIGYEYKILDNGYNVELDRSLFAKYNFDYEYDSIYLDFDDTLVFNNKINRFCLLLLYQCKEKGIPVILLTRHKDDIYNTLERYDISKSLFEKIIVLKDNDKKVGFIKHHKPLFIDNAFSERLQVYEELKIPVLDTDNITLLLDWKS